VIVATVVAVLGLVGTARAAIVTITDCVADSNIQFIAGVTTIDVGTDDLVLNCDLAATNGNASVAILGNNIAINGSITASGRGVGIDIAATGALAISGANLHASDGNGSIALSAVNDITITKSLLTAGNDDRSGESIEIMCTGLGDPQAGTEACDIVIRQTTIANVEDVTMMAQGDLYFALTQIHTSGPRDNIILQAKTGHADMRGCGNIISSSPEGNLLLTAFGHIDLAFAKIIVARDIDILAGPGSERDPPTIRLTGTTVRNDFGKKGDIVVKTANDAFDINICGATIIDDNGDVAELNGQEAVPHNVNVTGPPDIDE
jgi:hypothetical protein